MDRQRVDECEGVKSVSRVWDDGRESILYQVETGELEVREGGREVGGVGGPKMEETEDVGVNTRPVFFQLWSGEDAERQQEALFWLQVQIGAPANGPNRSEKFNVRPPGKPRRPQAPPVRPRGGAECPYTAVSSPPQVAYG